MRQPFAGSRAFRGISEFYPSVQAPKQRPDVLESFALEKERQPGARSLVRSSAVHYDRFAFWDFIVTQIEIARRDMNRAGNPEAFLLIGEVRPQIYNGQILALPETLSQLLRGNTRSFQQAQEPSTFKPLP
jgi:hypothetical protein